jgi:RNA polymerase sigma factor (TIGR02999 family)
MPMADHDVTKILARLAAGEIGAEAQLVPLLYGELHRIAERQLRGERPGHTLQPTALVNEAWLRLAGHEKHDWSDRQHFLAFASNVIRRILVDHARAKRSEKRGGGRERIALTEIGAPETALPIDILDLDDALVELERLNARHARVIELRFFSELTTEEIAAIIGISERTVKNDWRAARTWLACRLAGE